MYAFASLVVDGSTDIVRFFVSVHSISYATDPDVIICLDWCDPSHNSIVVPLRIALASHNPSSWILKYFHTHISPYSVNVSSRQVYCIIISTCTGAESANCIASVDKL